MNSQENQAFFDNTITLSPDSPLCAVNRKQLEKLASQSEKADILEQKLDENNRRLEVLEKRNAQLTSLANLIQETLEQKKELTSFRVARLMQIFRNPSLIGCSNRLSVLWKLISSRMTGKQFSEYHVFQELVDLVNNAVSSLPEVEELREQKNAPDSPDQSVLISIVLPIYNQADLAHESIDSVLAQTYTNWELIIVNDGSKDNLAEVVKPYLVDKRIHYLEQRNQKLPKALSNGFSFARGDLLTWTSADNNMHPQMLSKLAAFLRANPDSAMVYADYDVIDDQGNPFTESWFRPQNKRSPESPELHLPRSTELLNIHQDNFIGASFMYRQSTLKLLGDYDPQLGVEDYDYWMRINSLMKISHLGTDEILYSYRVHDNSLNGQAAELKILEKVQNLMRYEKQRSLFYNQPFELYSTYLESDLLYGGFSYHFHHGRYESAELPGAFDKRILLCKARELSSFTPDELERYNFIGVYFDYGTANEAGKNAYVIRRFNIRCFANPASTELQYLKVITNNCTECSSVELGTFAMIAANNSIFFNATRTKEERSRILPEPPCCKDGKIIVLLEHIGTGGMEQVAYDMADSFAKQGRSVLLASFHAPEKGIKIPENLLLYVLDENDQEGDWQKLLAKEKCAAVFAHYCTRGAAAAAEQQIPYFQVIHNTYCWFGEPELKQYRAADACTTAYIAVSATVAWYAMECLKLSPEKMIIIENSVELDRFQYSEEKRNNIRRELGLSDGQILFLNPASFYGAKGQMNLVRAFAEAYKKDSRLRLLIAGKILEQKYFDDIQNFVRENNLQDAIIMGKFFNDMSAVYSAADAVVFGSFWEGCSLAAAEAIRMQKIILSPKVGDIERQTDYKNCVLFDLPFTYLTELNSTNCGTIVYTPNPEIIKSLTSGMLSIASGNCSKPAAVRSEQSAAEVYLRYLKVLNYCTGNFVPESFRHNI